jgi:hypothetical protein
MIRSRQEIKITINGEEIFIEYKDLFWFSKFKFYVVQGNGQSKYVVANYKEKNRTIQLHQLILPAPEGFEIDHINNNGLDNRRSNLRIVTHQQNQNNMPKKRNSSSKYYGVYFDKDRKNWVVCTNYNGKSKALGRYVSEIEAACAYDNFIILNKLNKKINFGSKNENTL